MRYCVNRAAGVKDKKGGPQSNYYTDLHGFGAELAFGKHRNLYPDLGTSPRSGGSDFINANGEEIDIKCTQYKTGKLIVNEKKKNSSTKYFIVPSIFFLGPHCATQRKLKSFFNLRVSCTQSDGLRNSFSTG